MQFTSMLGQEPSHWRSSPNQTLPRSACVRRANAGKTNQAWGHYQLQLHTLIGNRLHVSSKSLHADINNRCEIKLTECTPEVRMAMQTHRSSSLSTMNITALIMIFNQLIHPVVMSACEMRTYSANLRLFSAVLCCPCMVPLLHAANFNSTQQFRL